MVKPLEVIIMKNHTLRTSAAVLYDRHNLPQASAECITENAQILYESGRFLLPKCRGVNLFVPAARQGSIKDKGKIQDGAQVLFHRV